MLKPAQAIEVSLQPGEVYFGKQDTRVRTLLGSCVSITAWHPGLLAGGICHYLLPDQSKKNSDALDGRYADEAVELMLLEMENMGACHKEFQVKLFGGGHMFSTSQADSEDHVGAKNVRKARDLVKQHGFSVSAEHLGGTGHRNIYFDIWSGHVWVRHQSRVTPDRPSEPNRFLSLCRGDAVTPNGLSGIKPTHRNGTLCLQ